jgi:galactokinase
VGEGLTVGARLSSRGRGGGAIRLMGQDEKEVGGLDSAGPKEYEKENQAGVD